MLDPFVSLAPLLLLPVVALMRFIGCTQILGDFTVDPGQHTLVITPSSVSLKPGQTQQFAALLDGTPSENVNWSPNAQNGLYKAPSPFVPGTSPVPVTATSTDYPSADAGKAIVGLIGSGAKFLPGKTDRTTQGIWKNKYGKDGWALPYLPLSIVSPPKYLDLFSVVAGRPVSPVIDPKADPRGLLSPVTSMNYAASWFDAVSLDLDLPFSDFETHQVAIYCVDWDETPVATQKFQIFDKSQATPLLLDTQTLASFGGGIYMIWELSGDIRISVTSDGTVAVISGIFFD